MKQYRNPIPTADVIIEDDQGRVLLVHRRYPPPGWALPGGHVDYGESCEAAAVREGLEETSLELELLRQFHTYSDPGRDPRKHTISTVFIARVIGGELKAGDDADDARWFSREDLPHDLAFDHERILTDFFEGRY